MRFSPAAFVEFVVFLAITAALISLHSRWLDNTLAIIWLLVIAVGSARLIYKRWSVRGGGRDSRGLPASGWSLVIPPRVMRWMLGESDRREPNR